MKERGHLEDLDVDGKNIKMDPQEVWYWAWTGLIWLRTGTGDGCLWMQWWTSGFL